MIQNLCKENPTLLNGVELKGKAPLNDGDSFSVAYKVFIFRGATYAKKRGYPNPFCSALSNPVSDVKISVPKATKNDPKAIAAVEKPGRGRPKSASTKSVKTEVVSTKTVLKAENPLEVPQIKVSTPPQAKDVIKTEKLKIAKTVVKTEKLVNIPQSRVMELVKKEQPQEQLRIEKTQLVPPKVQIPKAMNVPSTVTQIKSSQIKPSNGNTSQIKANQGQKSAPQTEVKTEKVSLVPPKVQAQPSSAQTQPEKGHEKQQGSKPSVKLFNTISNCVFNSFHELSQEREAMLAAIDRGEKISRNNVLKPYCATLFKRISAYGPIYPGMTGKKREKDSNESENHPHPPPPPPPDKKAKISFQ